MRRVSIDLALALTMNRVYLFWIARGFEQLNVEFICFSGLDPKTTKDALKAAHILQCFDDLLYGHPTKVFVNDPALVAIDRLPTFRKPEFADQGE